MSNLILNISIVVHISVEHVHRYLTENSCTVNRFVVNCPVRLQMLKGIVQYSTEKNIDQSESVNHINRPSQSVKIFLHDEIVYVNKGYILFSNYNRK